MNALSDHSLRGRVMFIAYALLNKVSPATSEHRVERPDGPCRGAGLGDRAFLVVAHGRFAGTPRRWTSPVWLAFLALSRSWPCPLPSMLSSSPASGPRSRIASSGNTPTCSVAGWTVENAGSASLKSGWPRASEAASSVSASRSSWSSPTRSPAARSR